MKIIDLRNRGLKSATPDEKTNKDVGVKHPPRRKWKQLIAIVLIVIVSYYIGGFVLNFMRAGTLDPTSAPASTMKTLQEIYDYVTTRTSNLDATVSSRSSHSAANVWTQTTRKLTKPQIECPSDMVYVNSDGGGFCIDKYEASPNSNCTHSYSGTGNPADQAETLVNLDDSDCAPQSVSGGAPWISISQGQAALACAKAGKRLPTNKEWFYAALGTPDYDAADPADNSEECHIWNSTGGPSGSTYIDHDDDANNAEAIASGSASSCVSTAGAYDMVGNVWEWVSDSTTDAAGLVTGEVSTPDYIMGVDGDGMVREVSDTLDNANYNEDMFWYAAGNRGFLRGGRWSDGADAGVFSLYLSGAPSRTSTDLGFRCAQ